MTIPRTPLILGLAGLIPFMLGAVLTIFGAAALPETIGMRILLEYSTVILAFMSGVLWGFAAKDQGWNFGYALSTLPALWAFFATLADAPMRLLALSLGFVMLLGLDWQFQRRALAPEWWLRLRLILTVGVLICLGLGGLHLINPMLGL
jgi:hypothetical protein